MNRLRTFFAIILFFIALPFWRWVDMVAFIWPHPILQTLAMIIWFMLFIAIPLKLIKPTLKPLYIFCAIIPLAITIWVTGPLSKKSTNRPDLSHCGRLTFTGFMYPLKNISSLAMQDDLEARNQLCMVRKMITRIPRRFDNETEIATYEKIVMNKLLRPENKYRVALPMIAILHASTNMAWGEIQGGKRFYDSLHFWINQYTEEITSREYPWWNEPYASYIKFEYGLIERNWQSLIDSIVIQGQ